MKEKSFVTCFDKKCEEFAELMDTLVSEKPSICNISCKREPFSKNRAITSNEFVLTIGPDGTKVNRASFDDIYNKYGIHLGYRGRKAWISCEKFDWTDKKLKEFHTELIQILNELGMNTKNIDDEIDKSVKEILKTKNLPATLVGATLGQIVFGSIVTTTLSYSSTFSLWSYLVRWIKNLFKSSERRKQQYKLAVVLFYHKYLNDFLEINEPNEDDHTEDEKINF